MTNPKPNTPAVDWLEAWKPIFVNGVIPVEFEATIQAHCNERVREARIDELEWIILRAKDNLHLSPELGHHIEKQYECFPKLAAENRIAQLQSTIKEDKSNE